MVLPSTGNDQFVLSLLTMPLLRFSVNPAGMSTLRELYATNSSAMFPRLMSFGVR